MTAGLPIRPAPAACRTSTASPILLHPGLITVFRGGTNTDEPWERFSVDQSIKSGRNGSGTKHLVSIAGHPSKYWPRSLVLNQPTVPVLQPPLHLSLWQKTINGTKSKPISVPVYCVRIIKTTYLLDGALIFDGYRHRLAVVTHVKYESDTEHLVFISTESEISLMEELSNRLSITHHSVCRLPKISSLISALEALFYSQNGICCIRIFTFLSLKETRITTREIYRQPPYMSRTLLGNTIVDHSDEVGASPVSAVPNTFSLST